MNKLTPVQLTAVSISTVLTTFKALEKLYNDMDTFIGVDPEAPMFRMGYDLFNKYVDAVSKNIGDDAGWLSWYIWDNDCGKRNFPVSWTENGKVIKLNVHTVTQLARVIRGHAER